MSFPNQISQTFPEAWPSVLVEMAAPMVSIELSPDDAVALGNCSRNFRASMQTGERGGLSEALIDAIGAALADIPEGVMPRMSYCSWKASMILNHSLKSTADVMQVITADDPRVARALEVMVAGGDPVFLHLRAWRDMPDWGEFRAFVRRGRVAGVSQYRWKETYREIAWHHDRIVAAIRSLLGTVVPELHLDDAILDLSVAPSGQADEFAATLIEINPFSPHSDPCLFSWAGGGDFDEGFRYNGVAAMPR